MLNRVLGKDLFDPSHQNKVLELQSDRALENDLLLQIDLDLQFQQSIKLTSWLKRKLNECSTPRLNDSQHFTRTKSCSILMQVLVLILSIMKFRKIRMFQRKGTQMVLHRSKFDLYTNLTLLQGQIPMSL